MHHSTSLAIKLHGDLYINVLIGSGRTYSPVGRNLPDANGRDGENLDEATVAHAHPWLET